MAKFDDEYIGIEDLLKTEDDKKSGKRDEISDPLSAIEEAKIEIAKTRSELRKGMTEEDALKEVKEKENAKKNDRKNPLTEKGMSYTDLLNSGFESEFEPEEIDTEDYTNESEGSSDENRTEMILEHPSVISPFTTIQNRPYQSNDMYPNSSRASLAAMLQEAQKDLRLIQQQEDLEEPVSKKTKTEIADTLKKEKAKETTTVTEPTKDEIGSLLASLQGKSADEQALILARQKDLLEIDERKKLRDAKSKGQLIDSIIDITDALARIGAARSGVAFKGRLVPKTDFADTFRRSDIETEFDEKRSRLIEGLLKQKETALEESKSEDLEKLDEKERKRVLKARKGASKEIEDTGNQLVKEGFDIKNKVDQIERDKLDGAEFVEQMDELVERYNMNLEEFPKLKQQYDKFKATVTPRFVNEDEAEQANIVTQMEETLLNAVAKQNILNKIKAGLYYDPDVVNEFFSPKEILFHDEFKNDERYQDLVEEAREQLGLEEVSQPAKEPLTKTDKSDTKNYTLTVGGETGVRNLSLKQAEEMRNKLKKLKEKEPDKEFTIEPVE